jgi:hypothetical protein
VTASEDAGSLGAFAAVSLKQDSYPSSNSNLFVSSEAPTTGNNDAPGGLLTAGSGSGTVGSEARKSAQDILSRIRGATTGGGASQKTNLNSSPAATDDDSNETDNRQEYKCDQPDVESGNQPAVSVFNSTVDANGADVQIGETGVSQVTKRNEAEPAQCRSVGIEEDSIFQSGDLDPREETSTKHVEFKDITGNVSSPSRFSLGSADSDGEQDDLKSESQRGGVFDPMTMSMYEPSGQLCQGEEPDDEENENENKKEVNWFQSGDQVEGNFAESVVEFPTEVTSGIPADADVLGKESTPTLYVNEAPECVESCSAMAKICDAESERHRANFGRLPATESLNIGAVVCESHQKFDGVTHEAGNISPVEAFEGIDQIKTARAVHPKDNVREESDMVEQDSNIGIEDMDVGEDGLAENSAKDYVRVTEPSTFTTHPVHNNSYSGLTGVRGNGIILGEQVHSKEELRSEGALDVDAVSRVNANQDKFAYLGARESDSSRRSVEASPVLFKANADPWSEDDSQLKKQAGLPKDEDVMRTLMQAEKVMDARNENADKVLLEWDSSGGQRPDESLSDHMNGQPPCDQLPLSLDPNSHHMLSGQPASLLSASSSSASTSSLSHGVSALPAAKTGCGSQLNNAAASDPIPQSTCQTTSPVSPRSNPASHSAAQT